jgi:hypothetical protein
VTDLSLYRATFAHIVPDMDDLLADPEYAASVADGLAVIRAAADPLDAVKAAWSLGYGEPALTAGMWCRMHGRPLDAAWGIAAQIVLDHPDAEDDVRRLLALAVRA